MLGGAYDGDRAISVALHGDVICCSGW